jgi:putative membrane protein insertion efficiency factor
VPPSQCATRALGQVFDRAAVVGALLALGVYRAALAPLLVGSCRYTPTCSRYAEEAIQRFGVWRGGALALARLTRCHPWRRGGWDPVPERLPL